VQKPHSILPLNAASPESPRVAVVCIPGGEGVSLGPHGHTFFEILYIEEGEGWHWLGSRKLWARAGDLFLIAPNEIHDMSGIRGQKSWIVAFEADALAVERGMGNSWLVSDDLLLLAFLRPKGVESGHFQVPAAEQPHWQARLEKMAHELDRKRVGFAEAVCAMLVLMLIDTARLASSHANQQPLHLQPLLASALRFIADNYKQQISLSDVARSVNRSPAYLTDFVRRETGRTVLCWIVEYRMAEARRLLVSTEYSVQQIAEMTGYLDAGHFSKQFRRLHNAPPQVWRHAHWKTNAGPVSAAHS
jgi:AraC-like DNA-binding protein